MTHRFEKTIIGRQEITGKSRKLGRSARNLLLIIDGTKPGAQWIDLINGASPGDLVELESLGLVERVQDAPQAPPPGAGSVNIRDTMLSALDHAQLYQLLTSQAKERLGLFRGFNFVLEIERCSTAAELRRLAVRFVGMVGDAQGERAARQLRHDWGLAP